MVYSICILIGNAVPLLFLEKDSPELVMVWIACLAWLIVLVSAYWIIDYLRSVNKKDEDEEYEEDKEYFNLCMEVCND